MAQNTLKELNNILFDSIKEIRKVDVDDKNLSKHLDKCRAVSDSAKQIINIHAVTIKAIKLFPKATFKESEFAESLGLPFYFEDKTNEGGYRLKEESKQER